MAVPSRVAQQCLEAVIHVLLDVAVKQCRPRLVGGKIHAGAPIGGTTTVSLITPDVALP